MRNPDFYKYIGLATQLLATLGVAFFIGYHADRYFKLSFPVTLLLLPLLVLIATLWKIVRDTSKPKK